MTGRNIRSPVGRVLARQPVQLNRHLFYSCGLAANDGEWERATDIKIEETDPKTYRVCFSVWTERTTFRIVRKGVGGLPRERIDKVNRVSLFILNSQLIRL